MLAVDELCICTGDLAGCFVGETERSLQEVFVSLVPVIALVGHTESYIETHFSCRFRAAKLPRSLPGRSDRLAYADGRSGP